MGILLEFPRVEDNSGNFSVGSEEFNGNMYNFSVTSGEFSWHFQGLMDNFREFHGRPRGTLLECSNDGGHFVGISWNFI